MEARELVGRVRTLVSLPEVCMRLNDLLGDERATAADVAEVLRTDPALTARLLKLVNSALYGLPRRVETVTRAVALVGMEEIRNLALASSAAEAFRRLPVRLADMDAFWRHSVYCANLSSVLGASPRGPGRERLFVAGLLHDVGWLVLFHEVPDPTRRVLEEARGDWDNLHRLEKEILGLTHAEVGAEILKAWDLPDTLWEPVAFHHDPGSASRHPADTAAVHIANGVAAVLEPGLLSVEAGPGAPYPVHESAWEAAGCDPDRLAEAIAEADALFLEAMEAVYSGYAPIY